MLYAGTKNKRLSPIGQLSTRKNFFSIFCPSFCFQSLVLAFKNTPQGKHIQIERESIYSSRADAKLASSQRAFYLLKSSIPFNTDSNVKYKFVSLLRFINLILWQSSVAI